MKTLRQTGVKGVNSEKAGSIGPLFPPSFRNGNSVRNANSLGGRWLRKELFQPKFEHYTKNSARKNFVFFKVLGMRSGWESEREILSVEERGVEGRETETERERSDTEKNKEGSSRKKTYLY